MTQTPRPINPAFRTRPARRGPPPIGAKVTPQIAKLAAKSGAMDPALMERWSDVAGTELAAICRPVRMRKTKNAVTLEVSVSSGAAAMRVQYAQNALLARARTALRQPRLTRLSIVQQGERPQAREWRSKRVAIAEAEPTAPRPARDVGEALERLRAAVDGTVR